LNNPSSTWKSLVLVTIHAKCLFLFFVLLPLFLRITFELIDCRGGALFSQGHIWFVSCLVVWRLGHHDWCVVRNDLVRSLWKARSCLSFLILTFVLITLVVSASLARSSKHDASCLALYISSILINLCTIG
jgi:hypothetical protein